MKRIFFLLIMVLTLPILVHAENFEFEIKVKVDLENEILEDKEFSFDLIDSNGELVQTKANDIDGNVTFDPIEFTSDDITVRCDYNNCVKRKPYGYKIYLVKQKIENEDIYILDKETAYIGVYLFNDGSSEINYLKGVDKQIAEWTFTPKKENSKVFHATEEQLQGQAYAVFDTKEKTLTFFRDEPGKYRNNQYEHYPDNSGHKEYFTDFEGDSLYAPWSDYIGIEKIIFLDPIKPKHIALNNQTEWGGSMSRGWFYSIDDLVEIENINLLDTSEVDSFNSLFRSNKKLKELDLSTWDTSNVQDMFGMFEDCISLEKVYLDNFNTSKVTHMDYMFTNTKIQFFDASIFDTTSLRRANNMFDRVEGIKGVDFSSWSMKDWYGTAGLITQNNTLKFVDASSFTYLTSNALMAYNLSIMRLGSVYYDISTSFGRNEFLWYNIDNDTLYDYEELREHLMRTKDLEPSTYVRPDDNPTPALFINKAIIPYDTLNSSSINDDNSEEKNKENPNTSDNMNKKYLLITIFTIINLILLVIIRKKVLNNKYLEG